jgi:hypothetical protein
MAIINYPKWVTPHATHVTVLSDGKKIASKWAVFSTDRSTGALSVLVNNVDEENKANAAAT